jgi:hypothetical protein
MAQKAADHKTAKIPSKEFGPSPDSIKDVVSVSFESRPDQDLTSPTQKAKAIKNARAAISDFTMLVADEKQTSSIQIAVPHTNIKRASGGTSGPRSSTDQSQQKRTLSKSGRIPSPKLLSKNKSTEKLSKPPLAK